MKAAIDIGTNTVLLLVAEPEGGKLKTVREEHRVPRLGKGVDADKNINEAATERVAQALREYREILDRDHPEVEDVIVTATSAVRDATNRDAFLQKMKAESGFDIRLLSGSEEAEWTAAGACSVLETVGSESLILDIGGGSTEVAYLKNTEVADRHSFDMGSVRFTERFMAGNPPAKEEVEACRLAVQEMYDSRPFVNLKDPKPIGVAGTVTTLAGMALDLKSYEPERLNGFEISRSFVEEVISDFSSQPHEQILQQHPQYLKGRSDIFLAGMLILEGFMHHFDFSGIKVSTGGIRHGAILKTMQGS